MSTYSKRLDKSRDFGTYHPPEKGAYYNQDGFDFDHEGKIVEALLTPEGKAKLAKMAAAKVPKPPRPQAEPASGTEGPEGQQDGEGSSDPSGQGNAGSGDELNLELWLRGQEDYQYQKVQAAVKARFHVFKASKRDLILFLVEEQKLVSMDDLSDELKGIVG